MLRRVMVTMNTGGEWIPPNVLSSHMAAASRWGAQYLQITATAGGDPFILKCGFLAGLADALSAAEQVLWLDGDVLVRHDCDNIFDLVPQDHFGGVANFQGDTHNGLPPLSQSRLGPGAISKIVNAMQATVDESEKDDELTSARAVLDEPLVQLLYLLEQRYDVETFINGGMFVFSPRHHAGVFDKLKGASGNMTELDPADEQAILNAAIILDGTPRTMLDRTYNRVGRTAWQPGPMTDCVQHLAHFRWDAMDSRYLTPDFNGDKTYHLECVNWRATA